MAVAQGLMKRKAILFSWSVAERKRDRLTIHQAKPPHRVRPRVRLTQNTSCCFFFLSDRPKVLYLPADCFDWFYPTAASFFCLALRVYVYTYNTKSINRSSRNIPFFQNFTKEQDIKKEPKTEVHEPQSTASRKASCAPGRTLIVATHPFCANNGLSAKAKTDLSPAQNRRYASLRDTPLPYIRRVSRGALGFLMGGEGKQAFGKASPSLG